MTAHTLALRPMSRPGGKLHTDCLEMPHVVPLVDARHPDYLDWREIRLAIDQVEGRWFHIGVLPKPGGRDPGALGHCPVFRTLCADLLNTLMTASFPDRGTHVLRFPDGIVVSHFHEPEDPDSPIIGFHVNAVSQRHMRELSQHDRMALLGNWALIARTMRDRRAAPMR